MTGKTNVQGHRTHQKTSLFQKRRQRAPPLEHGQPENTKDRTTSIGPGKREDDQCEPDEKRGQPAELLSTVSPISTFRFDSFVFFVCLILWGLQGFG